MGLVPLALAALGWVALARLHRVTGWLSVGEVIFWDAVLLDPLAPRRMSAFGSTRYRAIAASRYRV